MVGFTRPTRDPPARFTRTVSDVRDGVRKSGDWFGQIEAVDPCVKLHRQVRSRQLDWRHRLTLESSSSAASLEIRKLSRNLLGKSSVKRVKRLRGKRDPGLAARSATGRRRALFRMVGNDRRDAHLRFSTGSRLGSGVVVTISPIWGYAVDRRVRDRKAATRSISSFRPGLCLNFRLASHEGARPHG